MLHRLSGYSSSSQLCYDVLSPLNVNITAAPPDAMLCKITSDRQSNTRGGTRHQSNLAFQIRHTNSSFQLYWQGFRLQSASSLHRGTKNSLFSGPLTFAT